jgi:hypothetical protein
VSRDQGGGSPTVVNLSFLDQSRYLFFQVAPHLYSQELSGPDSRFNATQKIWQRWELNPGPQDPQPRTLTTRPQRRSVYYNIYNIIKLYIDIVIIGPLIKLLIHSLKISFLFRESWSHSCHLLLLKLVWMQRHTAISGCCFLSYVPCGGRQEEEFVSRLKGGMNTFHCSEIYKQHKAIIRGRDQECYRGTVAQHALKISAWCNVGDSYHYTCYLHVEL